MLLFIAYVGAITLVYGASGAVLATLTGALALPLGLALAWSLLAIVNVEAFGWRLPMYLFPLDYLRLGMLTLLAAAIAAILLARLVEIIGFPSLKEIFSS